MQQKNKIKVLVTSAGTASAISVIKALKKQIEIPVEIYATDMDPLAAGLYLADHFFISPPANDTNYIPSIIAKANEHGIRGLFPIYSREIKLVATHADELKAQRISTFLPDPKMIDICDNKLTILEVLKAAGLDFPVQYSKPSEVPQNAFPVFFKPNFSSSSKGAVRVDTMADLQEYFNASPGGIIQEMIVGDEVTVDVFCNAQSEPLVISPRKRISVKSGQTVKGETLSEKPFRSAVQKICTLVKMKGVCNIQFFLSKGKLIFLEINPRFAAGGLMLTVAAGANIPLLVLKSMLGLPISVEECKTKSGVKMTRYWEEVII